MAGAAESGENHAHITRVFGFPEPFPANVFSSVHVAGNILDFRDFLNTFFAEELGPNGADERAMCRTGHFGNLGQQLDIRCRTVKLEVGHNGRNGLTPGRIVFLSVDMIEETRLGCIRCFFEIFAQGFLVAIE